MSKLLKICMVVAAVLSFTGCYNDFDDPAPAKVWTEADFMMRLVPPKGLLLLTSYHPVKKQLFVFTSKFIN